jgi:hypothetical protein
MREFVSHMVKSTNGMALKEVMVTQEYIPIELVGTGEIVHYGKK